MPPKRISPSPLIWRCSCTGSTKAILAYACCSTCLPVLRGRLWKWSKGRIIKLPQTTSSASSRRQNPGANRRSLKRLRSFLRGGWWGRKGRSWRARFYLSPEPRWARIRDWEAACWFVSTVFLWWWGWRFRCVFFQVLVVFLPIYRTCSWGCLRIRWETNFF